MPRERALRWEGCWNVRDLGGLPTEDGGETAYRRIVRSDAPTMLSPSGWDALEAYGIRRIVDLRHEDAPYEAALEVVRVPLVDPPTFAEVEQLLAGVDDAIEWRRRNYVYFLERFPKQLASAISAVARAPEGAVLVHCAGGIDRTGLVCALLLRVAGVSIDVAAGDYAESAANWAPFAEEWIDGAPDDDERRKRRFLSGIPAVAMEQVLLVLEREHGSARAYLSDAGVYPGDLDRIEDRLRG